MAIKRVSSGRLDRVGQRRRSRQWRIIVGVAAVLAVAAVIVLAFYYKSRWTKKAAPPAVVTAETGAPTATTAAGTTVAPPSEGEIRLLLVNDAKVPQRYGNALAVIEQLNVSSGNVYSIQQYRPKIVAGDKTRVLYRAGFETASENVARALGPETPRDRADITVTCGQDISRLILEAMAKNAPAAAGITVEVLNGSGIEGAAGKMRERLEANGYGVVAVANAASFDVKRTAVEAPGDRRDAALALAALFGLDEAAVEPASYDVKVVVGDDYAGGPTPGM